MLAKREAELQDELQKKGDQLTKAEVEAQSIRARSRESDAQLTKLAEQLHVPATPAEQPLTTEQRVELDKQTVRLQRRRELLGPVNPLAKEEYEQAIARVEELEQQRGDLETALRELRSLIRDTDRQIKDNFEQTFAQAAANFTDVIGHLFPGGTGKLRLVDAEKEDKQTEEGAPAIDDAQQPVNGGSANGKVEHDTLPGVEIEIAPAGKSKKRLSLLSGGEKSLTALGFLFAVFIARPCPFYILDEVEAALDDLNIDRFLSLLERYSGQAQFIVVTHQKRTMEAADWLYGVSMGDDGVSKVISRKLPPKNGETITKPEADNHSSKLKTVERQTELKPSAA
jgi:chromosome segregation protein